jgi:hypothetical protein
MPIIKLFDLIDSGHSFKLMLQILEAGTGELVLHTKRDATV